MKLAVFINDELKQEDIFDYPMLAEIAAMVAVKLYEGAGHRVEKITTANVIALDVITQERNYQ